MDIIDDICGRCNTIKTIDMHTSGEATRIIVKGYPELLGATLLEKRRYAKENHDGIRKRRVEHILESG